MTELGVDEASGIRILPLSTRAARELVRAESLNCMVHLILSFRLAELTKFEEQGAATDMDSHLVCAKEAGRDEICGLMLYKCAASA
eukprot:5934895-Prymnesium_polylepis.2